MGITVVISSVLVSSEVGESPMRTELADVDKEKHGPTSYHSGEISIKADAGTEFDRLFWQIIIPEELKKTNFAKNEHLKQGTLYVCNVFEVTMIFSYERGIPTSSVQISASLLF